MRINYSKYDVVYRKSNPLIFLNLLFGILSGNCLSQEGENVDIISELVDSTVVQLVNFLDETRRPLVVTNGDTTNKLNRFFESRVKHFLTQKNVPLFEGVEASGSTGSVTTLFFNVLDLAVEYDYRNEETAPPEKIRQNSRLVVYVRVARSPSNEILWNGNLASKRSDWIAIKKSGSLLNNLAQPGKIQKNPQKNIWEPIIVSGVTGIVVYLFYALRSR